MAWWRRLLRRRADEDLDEEISSHLAMAAKERMEEGDDRETARLAALREFGSVTLTAEQARAERRGRVLAYLVDLVQDLRYGARLLARNPGFTSVAVLSLAIGIGANCAVFSFADALVLRPYGVPQADDVVTVGTPDALDRNLVSSYREYLDIRTSSGSFDGLIAFTSVPVAFAPDPQTSPKLRLGMLVSDSFFAVMRVEPQIGRAFRPDEHEVPGRDAVLLLGYDLWQQQFGGDPGVVGRMVRLNEVTFTIVGVMPASFTGLEQHTRFDFYAPLMMWPRLSRDAPASPFERRDVRSLTLKGRLKDGVALAEARTELGLIGGDFARAYPDTTRNKVFTVRTELQMRVAQSPPLFRLVLLLTMLAAAVLFVACANVAGLLTSRAPARAREIAVRLAIGAGRPRVVRQLIAESALLGAIGGVLALGVGYAAVRVFRQFQIPTDLPIVPAFALDRRALMVSLAIAFGSVALFGLTPAFRATRTDLTAVMKATDATGIGRRRSWGRAVLVTGQVAVSVVLLVVATIMYRGFSDQLVAGPGYRTDHLLQMTFNPVLVGRDEAAAQRLFEQIVLRARTVPGVKSAALASASPADFGPATAIAIVPEGYQPAEGRETVTVFSAAVEGQYFETIDLPIVAGRVFLATDDRHAPPAVVVNERLAQLYWPGQSAVGKRVRVLGSSPTTAEVVGVVKTTKILTLGESPRPFLYFAQAQRPQSRMTLLVESIGDPAALAGPLREMVRALDASLPIFNVRTIEESYRMRMVSILHIIIELVGAMGAMGLGLAIVGLYGLVAYAASRRTKEIGIRMAIGAERRDVLRLVVRQGMLLAAAGLAIGLVLASVASRALHTLFPRGDGGGGTDAAAFLLVGAAVLIVTASAAYIPARRASRVNPIDALRFE